MEVEGEWRQGRGDVPDELFHPQFALNARDFKLCSSIRSTCYQQSAFSFSQCIGISIDSPRRRFSRKRTPSASARQRKRRSQPLAAPALVARKRLPKRRASAVPGGEHHEAASRWQQYLDEANFKKRLTIVWHKGRKQKETIGNRWWNEGEIPKQANVALMRGCTTMIAMLDRLQQHLLVVGSVALQNSWKADGMDVTQRGNRLQRFR